MGIYVNLQCSRCGNTIRRPQKLVRTNNYCNMKCRDGTLEERFWKKVEVINDTTSCWNWRGAKIKGYGSFRVDQSKIEGAHRVSWKIQNGTNIDGMDICHKCDNPTCVRPDHLFAGTTRDNMKDMVEKGRHSGFKNGHSDNPVKLDEEKVRLIKQLRCNGVSVAEIINITGTPKTTINYVISGKTWKHVAQE